MVELTL
jgi:hypothetical protein